MKKKTTSTRKTFVVALLYGGESAEREVSITGAMEVKKALMDLGHNVIEIDTAHGLEELVTKRQAIDMAFLVVHGPFGEDGRLQGFLDMIGIPYQGAGVLGSAVAMDKHISKLIYRSNNIPTPDWVLVDKTLSEKGLDEIEKRLGWPVVVKPRSQGSSVGMGIAKTSKGLSSLLSRALEFDQWCVIEEFVQGREITVGVLEGMDPVTLPVVEIIPGEGHSFFDYSAKYEKGASEEICPADLPESLVKSAQELALSAHKALGLRHYSRTDMIVRDGVPLVLETNTIPGMTPTSLLPQAAQVAGLSFKDLIQHLIELAV